MNEVQHLAAEKFKVAMAKIGRFTKPLVTPIQPAKTFYPAEDYHQNYYKKNQMRYWYYRKGSARDIYLDSVWGEDRHESKLSPDNTSDLKQ